MIASDNRTVMCSTVLSISHNKVAFADVALTDLKSVDILTAHAKSARET